MTRMRTIISAFTAIKEADPNTALTMNGLRTLVLSGKIPFVRVGAKYLINLDLLEDYLAKSQSPGSV